MKNSVRSRGTPDEWQCECPCGFGSRVGLFQAKCIESIRRTSEPRQPREPEMVVCGEEPTDPVAENRSRKQTVGIKSCAYGICSR